MSFGAAAMTAFGMGVGKSDLAWPVAGLWVAAFVAPYGLSVWAAGCITLLGVIIDFMTEAPIGAWPIALLGAYGVGLLAWERYPPLPLWAVEAISVIGGMAAALVALMTAAAVAGLPSIVNWPLMRDFLVTGIAYVGLRFVFLPASVRDQRT
jgi:hypothetical protein